MTRRSLSLKRCNSFRARFLCSSTSSSSKPLCAMPLIMPTWNPNLLSPSISSSLPPPSTAPQAPPHACNPPSPFSTTRFTLSNSPVPVFFMCSESISPSDPTARDISIITRITRSGLPRPDPSPLANNSNPSGTIPSPLRSAMLEPSLRPSPSCACALARFSNSAAAASMAWRRSPPTSSQAARHSAGAALRGAAKARRCMGS